MLPPQALGVMIQGTTTSRRPSPFPRRSHDTRPPSPPPSSIDSVRQRSSSDATPKQRHAPIVDSNIAPASGAVQSRHHPGPQILRRPSAPQTTASTSAIPTTSNSAIGAMSSPSLPSGAVSGSSLHPYPRSTSRMDSLPSRDAALSPAPGATPQSSRPSPQKTLRTYDSKLISREMDRLGMSHHHGGVLTSHSQTLTGNAANASTLSLPASVLPESRSAPLLHAFPTSASTTTIPTSTATHAPSTSPNTTSGTSAHFQDTPWSSLHVYVLPLFNGEPLRAPLEDLNALVRAHIKVVLGGRTPNKAIAALESDVVGLVNAGMLNLNAKLTGLDDDKLVIRLVEVWTFFWVQVLPYVEGVFLPLQTDPILLSLSRAPKPSKATRPSDILHEPLPTKLTTTPSADVRLDVRRLALLSFRDAIILPRFEKLQERLTASMMTEGFFDVGFVGAGGGTGQSAVGYQQPRLQQMLLVLGSTSSQYSPRSGAEPPSPGEQATARLLRIIRRASTSGDLSTAGPSSTRASNEGPMMAGFAGPPRDRRGRINVDIDRDFHRRHAQRAGSAGDIFDADNINSAEEELEGDDDEYDDDDDDDDDDDLSDLGVPIEGTTPTVVAGGGGSFGSGFGMFGGTRGGGAGFGAGWERERQKEFLESLRSPNLMGAESTSTTRGFAAEQGTNGGGDGPGSESYDEDEDEDEEEDYGNYAASNMANWDDAQNVVERMVGLGINLQNGQVPP